MPSLATTGYYETFSYPVASYPLVVPCPTYVRNSAASSRPAPPKQSYYLRTSSAVHRKTVNSWASKFLRSNAKNQTPPAQTSSAILGLLSGETKASLSDAEVSRVFVSEVKTKPKHDIGVNARTFKFEAYPSLNRIAAHETSLTSEMTSNTAGRRNLQSCDSGKHLSGQELTNRYLARKKRAVIGKLMDVLENFLDANLATRSHYPASVKTAAGDRAQASNKGSVRSSGGRTTPNVAGQKRSLRSDRGDDSDSGEGDEEREGRGNKRSKVTAPEGQKRLACPFFKHDPILHAGGRACSGPGWYETSAGISRLKEHLYRCHKQPEFTCDRCCATFKNKNELTIHVRADVPCQLGTLVSFEGIDSKQLILLKKKDQKGKTPVQKWNDIYGILFPEEKPPSPYFDHTNNTNRISQEEADWREYVRDTLPERVEAELDRRYDRITQGVAQEIAKGFVSLVKDVWEELCQGSSSPKPKEPPIDSNDVERSAIEDPLPVVPFDFEFGDLMSYCHVDGTEGLAMASNGYTGLGHEASFQFGGTGNVDNNAFLEEWSKAVASGTDFEDSTYASADSPGSYRT